ncbi:hypothetical protein VTN31DRAFT_6084 [Thermomyces dupontii]|uniref:uncharacterized protein n=1 Tax=Talaromyces thermophilus TaxID=28565 RepID=UPI003743B803
MMIRRHQTKDSQRKVSPPGPVYMSNEQVANYLRDLRTNRPARPNGSRLLPSRSNQSGRDELPPRASSALSTRRADPYMEQLGGDPYPRASSALSHNRSASEMPTYGSNSFRSPPRAGSIQASGIYKESGQRWLERQEARSLRDALQKLDLQEEQRIHAAAREEATRLVLEHQNSGKRPQSSHFPSRSSDPSQWRHHLEKGSRSRNYSLDGKEDRPRSGLGIYSPPSDSGSAGSSSPGSSSDDPTKTTTRKKGRVNFILPQEEHNDAGQEPASRTRTVSGDSSKGVFRNPEDRIYEEPDSEHDPPRQPSPERSALKVKPRNSLTGSRPLPNRPGSGSENGNLSSIDIHKNPPSRSRNPNYTTNPPPSRSKESDVPTKDGLEIRPDDIRAATSMKLKDRSPKLPMPTAVSNSPGRPIVSFDTSWRKKQTTLENRKSAPSTDHVSEAPAVPSISVTSAEPTEQTPKISVSTSEETTKRSTSSRPSLSKNRPKPAQVPDPQKMPPTSQSKWFSPFTRTRGPTATCRQCSLPISGRIVTAAGERLHPECFNCAHCGTGLECVAFYQEPDAKRAERLANADPNDPEAHLLRFYCHLDYHELFSPRCKSCKTPIEGEVVVACGAEWHVGHFFCAECGDPFTQDKPYVEKDGYAWCLPCHSRRTASRCQGCKQPVLDEVVVTALGGQWHEKCFVCHECGEGFGPDGKFFVKQGEPRRTAKGRIIGGPVQLAVCVKCESVRLKA